MSHDFRSDCNINHFNDFNWMRVANCRKVPHIAMYQRTSWGSMPISVGEEIQRLYELEYGNRVEFCLRVFAIFAAAALIAYKMGGALPWLWFCTFCGSHFLYYYFLRHSAGRSDSPTLVGAAVFFAFILIAFLWFPIFLALQPDPVLIIAGASITCVTVVFTVRRSDSLLSIIFVQIACVAAAVAVLFVGYLPILHTPVEKVGIGFAAIMFVVYYAQAVFVSRGLRLSALSAAERSAQEQKLAAIGRLAGGVAHDFNNALTGISGSLELYHLIDDPVERAELITAAQTSSARAATLIRQLLVFSRRTGIRRGVEDGTQLIQEAANFQRRLLPVNVSMKIETAEPILIDVDKDLLVAALINLVVNAVDAMPKGGTLSFLATEMTYTDAVACIDGRLLSAGRYARLSVADTGIGIPPETLHRVIEPFFTTKPVGEGSGLGLSMVVGLAQSLGGGVQIESDFGGTKVSILVPVYDSEGDESARNLALENRVETVTF